MREIPFPEAPWFVIAQIALKSAFALATNDDRLSMALVGQIFAMRIW